MTYLDRGSDVEQVLSQQSPSNESIVQYYRPFRQCFMLRGSLNVNLCLCDRTSLSIPNNFWVTDQLVAIAQAQTRYM